MKLATYAIAAAVMMSFATGCASGLTDTKVGANDAASSPNERSERGEQGQWQRRKLADGVELVVSPEAGPEAQRVADMIQSEMRSRYIGAH